MYRNSRILYKGVSALYQLQKNTLSCPVKCRLHNGKSSYNFVSTQNLIKARAQIPRAMTRSD